MRHRIFVERIEPQVTVAADEFHHSVRVVRLRAGEEVELFDASGAAVRGKVESIERDHAVISAGEPLPSRESPLAIHLAMAIIQLERFEVVLQKATELGVRSIIPLVTERVELRPERYAGKSDRWAKIAFEAVKQSGRTRLPRISPPTPLAEILSLRETKVMFDADQPPVDLTRTEEVLLLIGPEGGWSDSEIAAARDHQVVFQRLGPRRLRAETAAIVATAVIAARFGDL